MIFGALKWSFSMFREIKNVIEPRFEMVRVWVNVLVCLNTSQY